MPRMDRDWENDFPTLSQFIACYFHQDFLEIDGSPEGALSAALRDASDGAKRKVIRELTTFMALELTDDERAEILHGPFGCDYNVSADGFTATSWMLYLKGRVEAALRTS